MKGDMLGVSAGLSVFPSLARNKLQIFIMAVPGSAPPAQLSEDPQRLWPRGVHRGSFCQLPRRAPLWLPPNSPGCLGKTCPSS